MRKSGHIRNRNKNDRKREKGFVLAEALVLIVIFSIIGTSIMALCYRKVFSAARNKTSMTEKTALYQASEFVLDSVRSAVETVAKSSDSSATFSDPFSSYPFTIYVNYENTDGSGENSDNEAVTIDKYSCIRKDGETNTYTVSFTATYGTTSLYRTTSLKVTAEITAVSSSEGPSDLTAKVSITRWEWEYHATIEEESAGAEEET